MALITIRRLDQSAIQSLTRLTPALPYQFKRGTTPRIGVQFANEDGSVYIPGIAATGVRTFTGQPANNDFETIAGVVYTYKTVLTGAAREVLIGASQAATEANVAGAINAGGAIGQTAGVTFGTGTVANAYVSAGVAGAALTVTARTVGTAANALGTSRTGASGTWASATLTGGAWGTVTFGAKPPNPANGGIPAFDGPYAVVGSTNAGPDENGVFWLSVSFSNATLNTALRYDPPVINNDIAEVTLAGEVRTDVGADIEKSMNFSVVVLHDINQGDEPALTNTAIVYRGSVAIGNGVDFVSLAGLALPAVPTQAFLSVSKLTGGLNLTARPRKDSRTTDGLIADLDGITDSADYVLDYLIFTT